MDVSNGRIAMGHKVPEDVTAVRALNLKSLCPEYHLCVRQMKEIFSAISFKTTSSTFPHTEYIGLF
jgi:hypothetical protein